MPTKPNPWRADGEVITRADMDNVLDPLYGGYRLGHTYALPGDIVVATGDTNYILPFFVSLPTGQSAKIVKCRRRINSGTSATCRLTKNGVDITGFTGISVTTTTADTTGEAVLADGDLIALVVDSIAGGPKNMTFSIFIQYQ